MGVSQSKEDKKIWNEFQTILNKHMPTFIDSEHCQTGTHLWIDPVSFLLAFQSYLRMLKLNINNPIYNITDPEYIKYYFICLHTKHDIYVTGSCSHFMVVGITIKKWPGNFLTNDRPRLMNKPMYYIPLTTSQNISNNPSE